MQEWLNWPARKAGVPATVPWVRIPPPPPVGPVLNQFPKRSATPLLRNTFAGDLNDRRGEPALRHIRSLDDLRDDLIQTGNAEFFDNNTENARRTYPFQGVRGQIGHILVSRSVDPKWEIASVVPIRPTISPWTTGRSC